MKNLSILILSVMLILLCSGCDEKKDAPSDSDEILDSENPDETPDDDSSMNSMLIEPGIGVGGLKVGMTYKQVKEVIGEPESSMGFNRLILADYKVLGLELLIASPDLTTPVDSAKLMAIGAKTGGNFSGMAIPGMSKEQITAAAGSEGEDTGKFVYYPAGFSVEYVENIAVNIGIFNPYILSYDPPEMEKCKTAKN